ncbi:MAG TPA: hypothetical protein VF150_00515 [Thermoanaerobaculia bacterium]
MALGIVHHFPGGTKEQYEASLAAVHPGDGSLPDGQIFHAAGPSAGGWTIMAVHESQSSWERFRDGILLPKLQAGIEGGFDTPPVETQIDVYRLMP